MTFSSCIIVCTILLALRPLLLRAAQTDATCIEYFSSKDLKVDVSDNGTWKVGDVVLDMEKLSNSSLSLDRVGLTLNCHTLPGTFVLQNYTVVVNRNLTTLPCNGNVVAANCLIECHEDTTMQFTFTVVILRSDHADPYFTENSYSVSVSEYTKHGTSIFSLDGFVHDDDCNSYGMGFIFALEGPENGIISVKSFGDIYLEKQLDYESGTTHYSYNVSVMHTEKMAFTNFVIEVKDEDDMDPAFTTPVYMLKIPEDNASLTKMWLDTDPPIYAEDLDMGEGKQNVSYFFTDPSSVNEEFELDPLTGKIRVNVTLDREKKEFYVYGIKAQQDNDHLRSATATLSITVLDVNDNVPIFTPQSYDISINEHPRVGMSVTSVTATDADQAENAVVLYRIEENDYFDIDENTGLVTVRSSSALDREKTPIVTATIKAIDKASGHEGGNITLTVKLLDINDNAPVFTQHNYSFHLSSSEFVGRVEANDGDIGNNSVISYSLFDSLDSDLFHVDEEGNITRSKIPANKEFFTILVVAKDHGYPQLQSMATVTMNQIIVFENQVKIGAPVSLESLKQMIPQLERDIGDILKLIVKVEKTASAKTQASSFLYISAKYLNKTDVTGDDLSSAVIENMGEIQALFQHDVTMTAASTSKEMSAAEIALIVIAGVILCGSILVIVILFRKYNNFKRYNQLSDHLKRRSSLYESQEIKMKMEDETSDYDGSVNTQEIEAENGDKAVTIVPQGGKAGEITAFCNPIFHDNEQTTMKIANEELANNATNTDGSKALDSNEMEETLSSLDDALDAEDANNPPADYENEDEKDDDANVNDIENLINTKVDKVSHSEERTVHTYENTLLKSDIDGEMDEKNNDKTDDDDDDDDDEPRPDYNVKEVRFSAQVLDTDENKFEPLKIKEIPAAPPVEEVDGEAHTVDTEDNLNEADDRMPIYTADESDRVDEEMISPVDFLKPEATDENGAVVGTFHFGLEADQDEVTRF